MVSRSLIAILATFCTASAMATATPPDTTSAAVDLACMPAGGDTRIEQEATPQRSPSLYQVGKGKGGKMRAWYEIRDRFSILYAATYSTPDTLSRTGPPKKRPRRSGA